MFLPRVQVWRENIALIGCCVHNNSSESQLLIGLQIPHSCSPHALYHSNQSIKAVCVCHNCGRQDCNLKYKTELWPKDHQQLEKDTSGGEEEPNESKATRRTSGKERALNGYRTAGWREANAVDFTCITKVSNFIKSIFLKKSTSMKSYNQRWGSEFWEVLSWRGLRTSSHEAKLVGHNTWIFSSQAKEDLCLYLLALLGSVKKDTGWWCWWHRVVWILNKIICVKHLE